MPVYYQKPEFLQAAIKSILGQTYPYFRLIIVIDGAPSMYELVKEYTHMDSRVEVVVNPENMGVSGALNTGFRKLVQYPSLPYWTWVSSDNIYYPYFLEVLRRTLIRESPGIGLVYSSFRSINDRGEPLNNEKQLADLREYQSQPKEALLDACIIGVSFMYRARYAQLAGEYRYNPVEDYDYWLRLTEHCEIRYIPVELMDYRSDSQHSVSSQLKSKERHQQWRFMYHLTRYEARCRRGIKPEVTILYCVNEVDQAILNQLESLYEQLYSNYYLWIIDCSPDKSASYQLSSIPHPVIAYKWFPNQSALSATFISLQFVTTPYIYLLGQQPFTHSMHLYTLLKEMQLAEPYLYSNFYTDNQLVGYRTATEGPIPGLYSELFRTEKAIEWYISNYYS